MKANEVWQAYTEAGNPVTDVPLTKLQAAKGVLHGASHVWIWRKNGGNVEILLQKRVANKRTWPGFYDISTAGHIDFGETPLAAAVREAQEELGITIKPADLKELFTHRFNLLADGPEGIIENEIRWVYSYQLRDTAKMTLAEGELESVGWVSMAQFRKLVDGKVPGKELVPQGKQYFLDLIEGIESQV
jgi:isopentenyldiphosphate isomerase